jgi:hypothetical protein
MQGPGKLERGRLPLAEQLPTLATMVSIRSVDGSKMDHYREWIESWRTVAPSNLPVDHCLTFISEQGPRWLLDLDVAAPKNRSRLQDTVACFKAAAKARSILLGGKVPPSCDACDVLSENYDARVDCDCPGLFPVSDNLDATELGYCGCKAIERMMAEGHSVNSKENEWNNSTFFSSQGLTSAMVELALCHADSQEPPLACYGTTEYPEVQAPDRKPTPDNDLDDETYHALFPTNERMRLSADAKHFFAIASGVSLVDPGIQMAIADSGNDILIGDYCDAATEDRLAALQKEGAAGFSFLKVCVYAGLMSDWQFDHLVAQIIQFRILSYWRDHAVSRRPRGVYGSRMTGREVHRHIDLGMVVAVVSASLSTGETITAGEYADLVDTTVLLNDLLDFRGDAWRKQRENVVLKGVRGCLCTYLDGLITECITGAAGMIRRGMTFGLVVTTFCNWMLMSSGHKMYEILHGTRPAQDNQACTYASKTNGAYEQLLDAIEPYGTLGELGPSIHMTRKELQLRYSEHRRSSEEHLKWVADVVRVVLHPDNLRRLVDVVHYQWDGEVGDAGYCA